MTLSTSGIKNNRYRFALTSFVYICFTMFAVFFGAVYEAFSHEVYSYYMIYAFALPLFLGVFPFAFLLLRGSPFPGRLSFNLYNSGIASLTVGCIIKGMLDIYGTTNGLLNVYFAVGIPLVLSGAIIYFKKR